MEKYGSIPPRFTKAWWEYFWYYYKWRVVAALAVIFLVILTCVQCARRIDYDTTITYIGDKIYMDNNIDTFETALSQVVSDADGDKKNTVLFQQIRMPADTSAEASTEYSAAALEKSAVEFAAGETFLFLFSRQELDRRLNMGGAEDIFQPLDASLLRSVPPENIVTKDGAAYAVSLKDNPYLKSLNFYCDDLYLTIRLPGRSNKQKDQAKYQNAISIAQTILSQ